MKCTDFTPLINAVRNIALSELADAVKAHGGKYHWPTYAAPAVLAESDEIAEVFVAKSIELQADGSIELDGHWRDETGRMYEDMRETTIYAEDVVVDDIPRIISSLPDPE